MDEKRLGAGRLVAAGIDTHKGRHAPSVVDELQREGVLGVLRRLRGGPRDELRAVRKRIRELELENEFLKRLY